MSPSPLYERVESILAASITDGTLPPETQLPPEESLIERFKVSRTTVRKAIQNLVERGLVEVRRGKGTFVTQPKITQDLTELTGFVEDMQALGRNPTARLVDKRVVAAAFHAKGVDRVNRVIEGWLERQSERGLISLRDPHAAAGMLRGMMIMKP